MFRCCVLMQCTFFFSGELCSLLFSPPSSCPVRGSVPLTGSFTPASVLDVLQPVKSTPAAHHSYTKSICYDSSCMIPTVQICPKSHYGTSMSLTFLLGSFSTRGRQYTGTGTFFIRLSSFSLACEETGRWGLSECSK